jgi:predicted  nucleic acid-binding Zn-ribbon protein
MHVQLEILLQLQDLKAQRRELLEGEAFRQVEEEEFRVDVDAAVTQLSEKIREVEEQLAPPVRKRYDRILASRGLPTVPVIGGTCYGCFVSIATATVSEGNRNEELHSCDNCGRFVYFMD